MERTHQCLLAHLGFDGRGTLLDVGCGSGALSIRAALTWPEAQVTGIDYWGVAYGYGQPMCEKNAESEGVGFRCAFRHGDANKLDFPDESFDAVVSNYVYHNVICLLYTSSRPLSRRVGETVLSARCGQIQIEHPLEVWKTPPGQSDGTGLPRWSLLPA